MTESDASGIEVFDTGVELSGLMAVLSQHLYSTPDVALRELVQNSHDSITRRHMADPTFTSGRIDIATGDDHLHFRDNGAGLTEVELHEHLATIGVGGTRAARERTGSEDLIGMFGLGFLSAFVIADEVTVTTTSVDTPDRTWQYSSSDGFRYTVLRADSRPIGTTVSIRLAAEHRELARPAMTRAILDRYCRLLPHPVHLDNSDAINLAVPWRIGETSPDQQLAFARRFEHRFEPLAAIPISAAEHGIDGVLWLHGGSTYGNADNRRMSVFVRGMLLAENDIDLLPRWAGFVSGVIESARLTPTASRETLKQDSEYVEAQVILANAVSSGLAVLARNEPQLWQSILLRHGEALIGAALTDDQLFDLLAEQVTIPTSQGDRHAAGLRVGNRIFVSTGSERGFEELLFHAMGTPIARGARYGVVPFLHRYAKARGLEVIEIGTDEGNASIFEPGELAPEDVAWLQRQLAGADEVIAPAHFEPSSVPLVVVPDRASELRQRLERDQLDRTAGAAVAGLARLHAANLGDRPATRVYVNLDCPTIGHLLSARADHPVGATRAITFLRSIKTLMVAADHERGGQADLATAFDDTLAVLDGLLLERNPDR